MTILSRLKAIRRIVLGDDGPLRLPKMLERHGASMEMDSHAGIRDAAFAVRRCVYCADKEACDAWLASGAAPGETRFCPNTEYLRRRVARAGPP